VVLFYYCTAFNISEMPRGPVASHSTVGYNSRASIVFLKITALSSISCKVCVKAEVDTVSQAIQSCGPIVNHELCNTDTESDLLWNPLRLVNS